MKHWIFLFFLYGIGFSQTILQKNIDAFIGVDIYDSYYYLQKGSLHKSGLTNDYFNIELGTPDEVDISNPLQILLLYRFFNQVVVVDNQLNYIASYPVPLGTQHMASASKDQLWIFNNINHQLSLYNLKTQKTTLTSIPFTEKVARLKGNLNHAFVVTTEQELFTFNFLARKIAQQKKGYQYPISLQQPYYILNQQLYQKEKPLGIHIPNPTEFDIANQKIYFLQENTLYVLAFSKK